LFSTQFSVYAQGKEQFGESGLYIISIIGGLANKDDITLTLSKFTQRGVEVSLGWKLIMTAVISNMAFKITIARVLRNRQLAKWLGAAIYFPWSPNFYSCCFGQKAGIFNAFG